MTVGAATVLSVSGAASDAAGGLAGWVVDVIERIGPVGVGVLILLENLFPPIPSEVILPFAGFSAARGDLNSVLAWLAATIGALIGAYVLYGVGALAGYDRVHDLAGKRWFVLFNQRDLVRGERFFSRHGSSVVLIARFVPFIRSVVSVPAGVARMPLWRFTVLTGLGSGMWNAIFIYAGYRLGDRWADVEQYLQPVSYTVVGLVTVIVGVLIARNRRQAG